MPKPQPLEQRFWPKVDKNGPVPAHMPHLGQCWLWKASKTPLGYGWIGMGGHRGKIERAHRVSYMLHFGTIPKGMEICHACDNPSCVNPSHLFLGSHDDNMADMATKGRWTPRSLPKGELHHLRKCPELAARGEACGGAKLTEEQVRMIRSSCRSQRDLARELNVDRRTIAFVRQGKTWRHVS